MRAIPGGPWGRVWIATLALVTIGIVGMEWFVRSRGYVPSIKDDAYAWSLARGQVSDDSPRTVAVLGTSRILLAFSPQAFREVLPGHKYLQLAVQGNQPIATLRDLAFDPAFRGVAVIDIGEPGFDASNWHSQDAFVATYHRGWRTIGQLTERWLSTHVQSRVALLASDGIRTLGSLLREHRWPAPRYTTMFADRTRFADYALTDVERRRAVQLARLEGFDGNPADAALWLSQALAQELYVLLIEARGGRVVYVRMPTCDERWTIDDQRFPRPQFWDRLASVTRAETVHFKDVPALAGFACPDTSHIASKDGPAFTRGLLEVLIERGVIQR